MDINFDSTTVEEIRRDIFKFRNDINKQYLEEYYNAPSYAEILGVNRKEIHHSNFLAWILNDNASHSLSKYPIKKFLEVLVKHCKKFQYSRNKEFFDAIVTDDISFSSLAIEREKNLNKSGRLDLYVETKSTFKNNTIRLIIENKVQSKENEDQTLRYFEYFEQNKREKEINIYVYLTPISGIDLVELVEPECICKEFIQINYQALVDSMLQPILNRNINDKVEMIITDYLQALSQPSIDSGNDLKQGLIMAIGNEERELLNKFWKNNQKLILTALYAISSDPYQEKDVRDVIKDAIGKISGDISEEGYWSKYGHIKNLEQYCDAIKEKYPIDIDKMKYSNAGRISFFLKCNGYFCAFLHEADPKNIPMIRVSKVFKDDFDKLKSTMEKRNYLNYKPKYNEKEKKILLHIDSVEVLNLVFELILDKKLS